MTGLRVRQLRGLFLERGANAKHSFFVDANWAASIPTWIWLWLIGHAVNAARCMTVIPTLQSLLRNLA